MDYRSVGSTGIQVSRLCYGTVGITKEKFDRCLDAGINFFDTADVYDDGNAEILLGELMDGMRDRLVISSKTGFPTTDDISSGGLSREHILSAVEGSLERLHTDWIDFYFVHTFDPMTDMEETLRALDSLVQQGKIRFPAVSNWAAWQIAKALGIAEAKSLAPFACIEPLYSLLKRQAEVEILPLAISENLGVVAYSPIAAGILTGKYAQDDGSEGRMAHDPLTQHRYANEEYFAIATRFAEHAHERGADPAALALAWVMSHPAVSAPIFGASTVKHVDIALSSLEIEMTSDWREEISALSNQPPKATDRLEEQRGYFYKGWRPD